MSSRKHLSPVLVFLILAATVLLATVAIAGDKEPCKDSKRAQTISIELEDDEFIVTQSCGEDSKVIMVNMNAFEGVVDDALEEISEALGELDDMQVKIHLGDDNMLSFADADSEWELDLGQIAAQVESALRVGFDEFDSEGWTDHHPRHHDSADMKDLQKELHSLRKEMKRLEKMLENNPPQDNR